MEHGEDLGEGGQQGRSGVCERSGPTIQVEALCFPLARNTCVPCLEHRGKDDYEYLIGRGCY